MCTKLIIVIPFLRLEIMKADFGEIISLIPINTKREKAEYKVISF